MIKAQEVKERDKEAVIQIRKLKKSFGNETVLSDINIDLFPEENLVVLGKSGSGKSVLIKIIAGLLRANSGTVNVFEKDVLEMNAEELDEMRQKIGFLFQSGALYDSMSVRENLEFPLKRIRKNLSETERTAKIEKVLESVGLADSIDKMPSQLSGGMRKRIGLARTIVVDPVIMLYDEPTTGLDPATSDEISTLILQVQKEYKTASVIITHDMACARKVANRVIMLHDGVVHKEGQLADFEAADDDLIKSFFKTI